MRNKKSKYKGVYQANQGGRASIGSKQMWRAMYNRKYSYHQSEKEAAIWVDKRMILDGKEPVNILKRK